MDGFIFSFSFLLSISIKEWRKRKRERESIDIDMYKSTKERELHFFHKQEWLEKKQTKHNHVLQDGR